MSPFLSQSGTLKFEYFAMYEEIKRFELSFDAGEGAFADGKSKHSVRQDYDSLISAPTEQPRRAETAENRYVFKAWSPALTPESRLWGDTLFTAVYETVPKAYTVTFDAGAGAFADQSKIKTRSEQYNQNFSFSEVPERLGYLFTGWSPLVSWRLTADQRYTATYAADTSTIFSVTFSAGEGRFADGSKEKTIKGIYGTPLQFSETPRRENDIRGAYTFLDWGQQLPTKIEGHLNLTARYDWSQKRKFCLKFYAPLPFASGADSDNPCARSFTGDFDEIMNVSLDTLWAAHPDFPDDAAKRSRLWYFDADGV